MHSILVNSTYNCLMSRPFSVCAPLHHCLLSDAPVCQPSTIELFWSLLPAEHHDGAITDCFYSKPLETHLFSRSFPQCPVVPTVTSSFRTLRSLFLLTFTCLLYVHVVLILHDFWCGRNRIQSSLLGPRKVCGLSCPGFEGRIPSVTCIICKSLFHSACANLPSTTSEFTCKVFVDFVLLFCL